MSFNQRTVDPHLSQHIGGHPSSDKKKNQRPSRVSSRIFQFGGGGGGGPASLASQILYLVTTLGKSLTRPLPGVAIKQKVWSARLGFSRSSMQRDLSMLQYIPLTLWKGGGGGGGFGSLQGWADHENLEGWDLIEAKLTF